MLEKKPKQNNKPLSRYYLCRIQKPRNITNKSLQFLATNLEHGKASLSIPGCWGNSGRERLHGHSETGLIAASCSNSYQSESERLSLCLGSTLLYIVCYRALTPGLLLPAQSLTPGTRFFAPSPDYC